MAIYNSRKFATGGSEDLQSQINSNDSDILNLQNFDSQVAGVTGDLQTQIDNIEEESTTLIGEDGIQVEESPDNTWTISVSGEYADLDTAQTFTAGQRGEVTTLTDGANISIDLDASNNFEVTLEGNRQLDNPPNAVAGQSGRIVVNQDAIGSRTLSYGTNYVFAGGSAPTLSTGADAMDLLVYEVLSSTEILVQLVADIS